MTVMRFICSAAFVSAVAAAFVAPASAGSVWEEARKVCTERYNDEVRSGTVPNGMNKTRYLNQCQGSYVRSVKLESELEETLDVEVDGSDAQSRNGQGGPEILVPQSAPAAPGAAAPARKSAPSRPVPKFKPTI